jgi:serine/threonine protein kinase
MPSIDLFSETIIQLKLNMPLSLENIKLQGFKGYEVLEVLGQGGMGVVFKARQIMPERIVAIKTLRPKTLMTQEDYERFSREASIIAPVSYTHLRAHET